MTRAEDGAVRRVCVVTTSRADYGLLRRLMWEIAGDEALELQVVATGMHLLPEFGHTVREITGDGFQIGRSVDMLLGGDSAVATAKSIGVGMLSFADALRELSPHIIVLLGDRFELLGVAPAALMLRIPIAHIHGGETTEGALDEQVRHALTKLATFHFPATEAYKRRIIQMGEDPVRVFTFGAPGLDDLYHSALLTREELEARLEFDLSEPVALITYHPVTLEPGTAVTNLAALLRAVERAGLRAVFTKANADEEGRAVNHALAEFCAGAPNRYRLFESLGAELYRSLMAHCSLMLGNSSSGLIEAPWFALPVVNIGERQRGRVRAANVIDCANRSEAIEAAIDQACSEEFRACLQSLENPYDVTKNGSASRRIKDVLKTVELSSTMMQKRFHDIP